MVFILLSLNLMTLG